MKYKYISFQLSLNYLAIAYAFLLPLSRAGIGMFSALLIVIWIVEGDFKKKYTLLVKNKVILALGFFIAFNILSLFWSDDLVKALVYVKKYWHFLPIVVLATSIKKEYISKILTAFIFGMFVSEVIAYGVFFEFWEYKHATVANPSPFMHHIEYSIFLAVTALVLLSRIFNEENIKYKMLYAFFFITISGNLFLTAGRTGQIALVLGLFVLVMLSFKNKIKALGISILLATLILGVAFNVSSTFHDRIIKGKNSLVEVVEKENYCTSWGSRVGAWIVSKDIIVENPILGVGIIDNMKEFHSRIDNTYPKMKCMHGSYMHVHNQYLQVFTSLGLIGLVLFLSIFYMIITVKIKDYEYRNIKYAYLSILAFAFFSDVLLHRQFSMALFALLVGLILAQNRTENEI